MLGANCVWGTAGLGAGVRPRGSAVTRLLFGARPGRGEGSRPFGKLAATSAPVVGRAFALHLLWHRRLGMDLSVPLTDRTLITAAVR